MIYLARSPLARLFIGWIFAHMSFALPVKRLRETPTLLAFHHPNPSYPTHVLLVPKKDIPSLAALDQAEDEFAARFLTDLVQCVRELVDELNLEQSGYRLIVNGGKYQDIPQLHFHLVSERRETTGS
ncbi:MAG: HIT domain-containing protein [Chloroflexota bacterium]